MTSLMRGVLAYSVGYLLTHVVAVSIVVCAHCLYIHLGAHIFGLTLFELL